MQSVQTWCDRQLEKPLLSKTLLLVEGFDLVYKQISNFQSETLQISK